MTIERKEPQLDPLKTLEQFKKMMELVKQFPVKKMNIRSISTTGKWETYPKISKLGKAKKSSTVMLGAFGHNY